MRNIVINVESRIPADSPELLSVMANVGFWNEQGRKVYSENVAGRMGSRVTQELAREMTPEQFILHNLAIDCQTFLKGDIKAGRSGDHVWVSKGNNRFLLIHFS